MKHFICYTTRDKEVTTDLLQKFSNELKKNGDVFVDLIDNDSEDKQNRVLSELDSSDILILIETSNVYKSYWVAIELQRAKANKIPIRIVKIEEISKGVNDEGKQFNWK
jgi:hypothetical protein